MCISGKVREFSPIALDQEKARPISTPPFEPLTMRGGNGHTYVSILHSSAISTPATTNYSLLQMQHSLGNHYVQRLLQRTESTESEDTVGPEIERTIASSRGSGQSLDGTIQAQMGEAFNADFSGVRVHTNTEADALNRSVSARAFTTGQDIYFREGEYNPGSASGKELLAHELTHVVQQSGGRGGAAVQGKLTVDPAGDMYEREADDMAKAYTSWAQQSQSADAPAQGVQRQLLEEDKEPEELQMQRTHDREGLQRQATEFATQIIHLWCPPVCT